MGRSKPAAAGQPEIPVRVRRLAEPLLAERGLDLVEVEFRRESHGWILRLYMDKPGGITLEDCQRVSEELSDHLDVEDFIDHPYHLEVSSPGLDRPLTRPADYLRFTGQAARIATRERVEGRHNFQGRLAGLQDEAVLLDLPEGGRASIPLELILRARLEPEL
ncbi:MAG TPA: ribosome maturation factor RimP [Candidatus Baltobacteraceae bacterium]|nr:ribosome maturation factor RimP [Candidatus Baltobacteraceae bacterium]